MTVHFSTLKRPAVTRSRFRSTTEARRPTPKDFVITLTDVNEAPTVSLADTGFTIPEDAATSPRIKVTDIIVTDDALGTNNLTLVGDDAALF